MKTCTCVITLLESVSHSHGCVMDRLTVGMPLMRWTVVSKGGRERGKEGGKEGGKEKERKRGEGEREGGREGKGEAVVRSRGRGRGGGERKKGREGEGGTELARESEVERDRYGRKEGEMDEEAIIRQLAHAHTHTHRWGRYIMSDIWHVPLLQGRVCQS